MVKGSRLRCFLPRCMCVCVCVGGYWGTTLGTWQVFFLLREMWSDCCRWWQAVTEAGRMLQLWTQPWVAPGLPLRVWLLCCSQQPTGRES